MIWPFRRTQSGLDQVSATLDGFVTLTIPGMNGFAEQKQRVRQLTECYLYGAIRYLVSYDEMQPGSTAILLQTQLHKHFGADGTNIERCLAFIKATRNGSDEQLFMIEGASALRRWLVNNDQSSGANLRLLLRTTLDPELSN